MPDWGPVIRRRLDELGLAGAREAELVEELSQHLADRYREARSGGAPEEDAFSEALAELEDADLVAELTRVERPRAPEPLALGSRGGSRVTAGLWHDLRLGVRLMRKEKGASAVIVATLSLAIAANTIVFGLTDVLLLRPLPVANESRVASICTVDQRFGTSRGALSVPQYLDVARQAAAFNGVAALTSRQMSLTSPGEPQAVGAVIVSANFFRVLGLEPVLGRTFVEGEDAPGRSNVVVLSHRFWAARFGSDRGIVGREVTLNGTAYSVVGILTPAIEIGTLRQADMWLPLVTASAANRLTERNMIVFGLLQPGATVRNANAELQTIADRLRREYPVTDGGLQLQALTLRETNVDAQTPPLLFLLTTIVGLVLLVACANVATIMMARATGRRTEIAVRLALGATRARLIRQFVAEGLLLGLLAGALGVLLTRAALAGITHLSPDAYLQQLLEINGTVLLFAFVLSVAAPVLFGVIPALAASRPNLVEDLKEGARDGRGSPRATRTRATLVVAQVAFALTVLVLSGLIVRSIVKLHRVPLGVTPEGVLSVRVRFDPPKYADNDARMRAVDAIVARLGSTPGVAAAAAMRQLPVVEAEPMRQFTIIGRPPAPALETPWVEETAMTAGYRETFGIALLEGRLWTDDDRLEAPAVGVVSREAARRYWPGESPVGQRIALLSGSNGTTTETVTIVGVVGDVRAGSATLPALPRLYRPLAQHPADSVAFAVRVQGDPAWTAPGIRKVLAQQDGSLAVSEVRRFDELTSYRLRTHALVVALFAGFAGIGLVLAMAGVYGVAAFSVGQRRHEIGVRLALGAEARDVVRDVVVRSFKPIAIGMAIGALGGWGIATTMRSMLFETSALDLSTYATVIGLLAAGGLLASFVPARRAASVDPGFVLKRE